MPVEPYPDQRQTLRTMWLELFQKGHRRVLLQLPTGGGKTVIAALFASACADRDMNTLFLVHRRELITQLEKKLKEVGLNYGIIAAKFKQHFNKSHYIASVQTLAARHPSINPDLIIVDEAHHATAKQWQAVLERWTGAKVLGLTATPERLDGHGLAKHFDSMVCGLDVQSLIDISRLAPVKVVAPPMLIDWTAGVKTLAGDYAREQVAEVALQKSSIADVAAAYRQHGANRRVIVFAVSIAHSEAIAERLKAAGARVGHIDGGTPTPTRAGLLKRFDSGELDTICNVSIIDEGFDCPACDTVLDAQPTRSLTRWLQKCGRAMRPGKDKQAVIIDCAGNVWRHGLPTQEREWSLQAKPNGKRHSNLTESLRNCGECFSVYPNTLYACPFCHAPRQQPNPANAIRVQEVVKPLAEIKAEEVEKARERRKALMRRVYETGGDRTQLEAIRMEFGYKPGWTHQMQEIVAGR